MKRVGVVFGVLAVVVLLWTGVACAQVTVSFPDPNLEAAVRSALGVPTGPLTADKVGTLSALYNSFLPITNLSGLEYATNLETLSLGMWATVFPSVTDLSPLSALSRLTYLYLPSNKVSDLRCLTNLTQIRELDISGNRINDAAPLLALTNLLSLDISYNPLLNYALVGGMANLTSLTLNHLSINDPSFVNGLTNLTQLNLLQNQIHTLPPLPGLVNLGLLDLSSNPLTNAAAVAGLTNVETLLLNQCPLADLGFLPALSRLHYLYLEYANLPNLSPLAALTNLSSLDINGNPFTNATALGALTSLQTLHAGYCSLTNLGFLSNLTQLTTLDLRANRISDTDPLLGLRGLQYLGLDRNRLTDISGLDGLPALRSLSLVQNLLDLSPGSPALTIISNLMARHVSVDYDPQNQPPMIQSPDTWTVPMDRTSTLYLYVYDDVTLGSDIIVTVTSANTNLVPPDGLALQDSPNCNLSLTPAPGQTGTTTLTLTATDDTGYTTTTNLTLTVYSPPVVTFADTNLETAVRNALWLLTGPITTYDLQTLNGLSASWAHITNLSGLEWATNLAYLYVSGNPITNWSPLLTLPALQTLDAGYDNLQDLSPLLGLTNLQTLNLDGNPMSNLAQLAGLPNLVSLSARSCSPSNLTGIGALVHLQSLFLSSAGLSSAASLATLTNLQYLDLRDNPLASMGGLAGLSKLRQLELGQCSLSNLGGLSGLTSLQILSLDYNAIRDVSPLAGLTNLIFLTLDSNPLTSLGPLAALPALATLSLGNCSLTNLASLQGLTALRSLYLINNRVRDLTPLAGLTNLNTLYLNGNSPADLAPLVGLTALSTLELSSCSLTNISLLAPLTQLRSLGLSYNRIADLAPLLGLTNLYSLSLAADRLTNLAGLQNLTGLRFLNVTLNLLDLTAGSPTMNTITNLQNQGAWVNYSPQNQPPTFYVMRTNWVVRPNVPADLQFIVQDDVTLADQVAVSVACSSAGPLSNSAIALVRTSFVIPSGGPGPPLPQPPPLIDPVPPGTLRPVLPNDLLPPIRPGGAGASYWDLSVTPTLNQTGTMTLTLTATDDTGFSASQTVLVTVMPPEGLDGAFLDATNLTWQTGGNAPWFGQTNVSHSGSSAAQSGSVGAGEESWLQTTVTGPGILTFWWGRVATGYGGQVSFTTSQGGSLSLPGTTDWRMERVSIPAGECVLTWSYIGPQLATTSDRAWLDQVSFVPTSQDFWLEMVPNPAPSLPTVTLHGEPSGFYEVQVSTNLVHWTVLNQAALNTAHGDFTAPVAYASAQTGPRFYRARQLPAGTMWFAPLAFNAAGAPVLQVSGKPGAAFELLTSTNLHDWSTLATLTNTSGTLTFTDTSSGPAKRFYRAHFLP